MAQREFGAFGELVEILVGDDRRDLEDRIVKGIEPGHFKVDPDQVVLVHHAYVSSSMSPRLPATGTTREHSIRDGFAGRIAARLRSRDPQRTHDADLPLARLRDLRRRSA